MNEKVAIRELNYITCSLSEGCNAYSDQLVEALLNMTNASSASIRLSAALCLRTVIEALPNLQASIISNLLEKLRVEFRELVTGTGEAVRSHITPLIGLSQTIATLISVVPSSNLGKSKTPFWHSFEIKLIQFEGIPSSLAACLISTAIELLAENNAASVSVTLARNEAGFNFYFFFYQRKEKKSSQAHDLKDGR